MKETTAKTDKFSWILPWCAAAAAAAIFLPIELYSSQWGSVFYAIVAAPLVCLAIIAIAIVAFMRRKPRRGLAIVFMLPIFLAMSWALLKNSQVLRSEVRWLFYAKAYKAEFKVSPTPTNGDFRHMEWDGWGFPGAGDTVVYLVFDPNDSLLAAAKKRSPGKYEGIPCEVPEVHRLERDWYTILFFTDTEWAHCS